MVLVIGPANDLMVLHVPYNGKGAPQEYNLHEGVVERDVICEKVQVARSEYDCIQFLRL